MINTESPFQTELPITMPPAANRRKIAEGIYAEVHDGTRRILIGPARIFEYSLGDRFYNNLAIAVLADLGCGGMDIARALDVHHNTVYRITKNVRANGIEVLVDTRDGNPGPRKLIPSVVKCIDTLQRKGLSGTAIHEKLQKKGNAISLRSVYRSIDEIRTSERKEPLTEAPPIAEQCYFFTPEETTGEVLPEAGNDAPASSFDKESISEEASLEEALLSTEATTPEADTLSGLEVESEEKTSSPENNSPDFSEPVPASPSFRPESGKSVSYAGAFFAWPYLSLLGLLPLVWQLYGESFKIKGKLYGLMQSISSFFFLNLLGFDNIESFKVVDREGFRRLIGAISSPTVKTLRGKLGVISSFGKAYEFLMGLAKRYCAMGMLELGVLYLDGHFIPYFGKRKMGKGYYTLRRLAHPGRTQHFVNDRNGRPLFFLLREANESFVKIIPELINETHSLVGDQQTTFVFDRGGQSGALFKEIEGNGGKWKFRLLQGSISSAFHEACRRCSGGSSVLNAGMFAGLFMSLSSIHAPLAVPACIFLGIHPTEGDLFVTYKKGKFRKMPGGVFRPHKVEYYRWGKKFEKTYDLWEGSTKITGYGNVRLILVKDKGKQTPIITNDRKRPAVELVPLMFNRWRQENFFKYMAANYSLDELVTQKEQEVKLLQVPNPRWHELEKKIRGARKQIAAMERGVGKIVGTGANSKIYDDERKNPFIKKVAALKRMKTRLKKLRDEQKQCPEKISPAELCQEVGNVIPQEGKIILDAVKLAVYNAEEWLLEILKSYYRDWRDPRTILRMILQQKGDIQVNDGVVKVTLHRFEKPSYQKAARGMCEVLTNLEAKSWDGKWRLEYEVAE